MRQPAARRLLALAWTAWIVVAASSAYGASVEIKAGRYLREGDSGTLVVKRDEKHELTFGIDSIGGNCHLCGVSGVIRFGTGYAVDERDTGSVESGCRIAFTLVGSAIQVEPVTEDSCRTYCGARASFDGNYVAPPAACTGTGRQKTRDRFLSLYRSRQYQQAEDVLQGLISQCDKFMNRIEIDQARNDVALAQYHNGKAAQCVKTLEATLASKVTDEEALKSGTGGFFLPPCDFDNYIDVARMTWFNKSLCTKANLKKGELDK